MQLQQIRNSTLKITYSGQKILTDPMLSPKHAIESFVGKSPNPIIDLPFPARDLIKDIDMVLISHLHLDHFDKAAQDLLPKQMPVFCQPCDEKKLKEFSFESVTPIINSAKWKNIQMTRTCGHHGTGDWGKRMGNVSGFIFKAENEPIVYWAGDTIWCDIVKKTINEFQPEIIITHSCGAKFPDSDPIIMDAVQTIEVCKAAPNAIVIATHMEALDHATISRTDLRAFAENSAIKTNQLRIPVDGEVLSFD